MSGLSIVAAIALPGLFVLALVAFLTRRQWIDALNARYRAATTDVCGDPWCDGCKRNDELVRAAFAEVDAEEARLLREFDEAVAIADAGAVDCGIDCDPMRLDNQWEIYAEDFEASATSGEEATA